MQILTLDAVLVSFTILVQLLSKVKEQSRHIYLLWARCVGRACRQTGSPPESPAGETFRTSPSLPPPPSARTQRRSGGQKVPSRGAQRTGGSPAHHPAHHEVTHTASPAKPSEVSAAVHRHPVRLPNSHFIHGR